MATHTAQPLSDTFLSLLYLPSYSIRESARLADANVYTLAQWFRGKRPVVPGKQARTGLSYLQLVEGAFVASFRAAGLPLQRIRKARDYLAETFHADYPFAQIELKTDGVHILREMPDGNFIAADRSGQRAWERLLADRMAQFDYVSEVAMRWHFRGRSVPLVVDPRFSFGSPTVEGSGIATWALGGRFAAGEAKEDILSEFSYVTAAELDAALEYEGLLQAA